MTKKPFMRVRLQGGRFKEAGLPFPILGDLEQLQNMVVDIARWRFREKRGRSRSPSGFDQTYLKITGLRDGSSVAEIDLGTTMPIPEGAPIPNREYLEDAGSRLVEAIESAGRGTEWNVRLPDWCMGYFNHIGRGLRNDEAMEISVAGRHPARLTQESRAVLVRHSAGDLMRDTTVRGTVAEVDQKNMTFRLQRIHGAHVECSFPERYGDTVAGALAGYKSREGRGRVRVQGTGAYDKSDRLQRVDPVTSVEPLDPLDVDARLDGFVTVLLFEVVISAKTGIDDSNMHVSNNKIVYGLDQNVECVQQP